VYGHGGAGTPVSVEGRDLRHALSGDSGINQLLSLKVGSETHLAVARALQRHPVRHTVMHVDFQIVRRDEVISADVPIVPTGEARTVEQEGGLVEQVLTTLTVRATPAAIPPHVEVDISGLSVGEGIRVSDLALPSAVTTEVLGEEIVVIASLSRAAVELEAEEAAAEQAAAAEEAAAEAEGGAPAEGTGEEGAAAPAGGGDIAAASDSAEG
jgi:large subunit ribosomal protein L25